MTIWDFLPLDKNSRNEIVLQNGNYISSRQERRYTFMLFRVYDFYVERVYHNDNEAFFGFIAFTNRAARIEPYLSQVPVEHLLLHDTTMLD